MKQQLISFITSGVISTAIALLFIFIFNLIRAPVFIKFESDRRTRMLIEGIIESHYGDQGLVWGILIKNLGTDIMMNCRGQLVDIDVTQNQDEQTMGWWPKKQYLEWASSTKSQSISIPGKTEAILNVVCKETKYSYYNPDLYITYSAGEKIRKRSPLHAVDSTVLLIVGLTANDNIPMYVICYFDMRKNLIILGTTTELMTIEDCRSIYKLQEKNLLSDRYT